MQEHMPEFVSFSPRLFTFWVKWETNAGTHARVCFFLPAFVYVLANLGNKSKCDDLPSRATLFKRKGRSCRSRA